MMKRSVPKKRAMASPIRSYRVCRPVICCSTLAMVSTFFFAVAESCGDDIAVILLDCPNVVDSLIFYRQNA
jgi:hypothetical protein